MNKEVFKSILWGIGIGSLLFFTGPLLLIIFLLKFIFTPFGMWRLNRYRFAHASPYRMGHTAYADKIRSMSDEEYQQYKSKSSKGCATHFCSEKSNEK